MEILFKEIDLIVLLNGLLGTTGEVLGSLGEAESGVSVELLLILGDISGLCVIELLRPTYILNYFIRRLFYVSPANVAILASVANSNQLYCKSSTYHRLRASFRDCEWGFSQCLPI